MSDERPEILAIRVTAMPRDTNAHGTIFGGHILSLIDQAGAIAAHGLGVGKLVTVAMQKVEFKQPVMVGDVVRFMTRLVRIGRTSITMQVSVEAERATTTRLAVTEAEVVYVGVDPNSIERRPVPLLPANIEKEKE